MQISKKAIALVVLLLAAIGYTIFNFFTGQVDGETAVLYVLVMSFPLVRMLSATLQNWKNSQ